MKLKNNLTGSFQQIIGDVGGISQPSMSRIFTDFINAVCSVTQDYVKFPLEDQSWLRETASSFEAKANIPNVVGLVDGFHVLMKKPETNGDIFLNRDKKNASINVQVSQI